MYFNCYKLLIYKHFIANNLKLTDRINIFMVAMMVIIGSHKNHRFRSSMTDELDGGILPP